MKEYCDTNPIIVDLMIKKATDYDCYLGDMSILEPQAGRGAIIKRLPTGTGMYDNVSFCEINQKKASLVHEETGATFLDWDFLKLSEDFKFDRIIAVSPFEEMKWLAHTYKAYRHLKENGKMVVLLPVEALNHVEFFKWVVSLHAKIEFIEGCACDYQCQTFILEIEKK